jgi:hypothetical protein
MLRLIYLAMIAGLALLTIVSLLVVRSGGMQVQPGLGLVLLPAVGATWLGGAIACAVVRSKRTAMARKASEEPGSDPRAVQGVYATTALIQAALLEGPGLFGTVSYLVTAEPLALVATGLSVIGMVALMPSRAGLQDFLEAVAGRR